MPNASTLNRGKIFGYIRPDRHLSEQKFVLFDPMDGYHMSAYPVQGALRLGMVTTVPFYF